MNQKYLTYRENDSEGRLCYYILQKEFPHYKGIISLGVLGGVLYSAPVPDYNMYVNFAGTLRGNFVPSYKDVMNEIEVIFNDMANWFLNNRVLAEPKKYLKYKI